MKKPVNIQNIFISAKNAYTGVTEVSTRYKGLAVSCFNILVYELLKCKIVIKTFHLDTHWINRRIGLTWSDLLYCTYLFAIIMYWILIKISSSSDTCVALSYGIKRQILLGKLLVFLVRYITKMQLNIVYSENSSIGLFIIYIIYTSVQLNCSSHAH